jgi:hypothetical protein
VLYLSELNWRGVGPEGPKVNGFDGSEAPAVSYAVDPLSRVRTVGAPVVSRIGRRLATGNGDALVARRTLDDHEVGSITGVRLVQGDDVPAVDVARSVSGLRSEGSGGDEATGNNGSSGDSSDFHDD